MNKVCTRCKQEKPVEMFCKHKRMKDGLNSWCKSCANEVAKINRENDPELYRERCKKYYRTHTERVSAANKKYRAAHTEETKLKNKLYRENHKEEIKEYRCSHVEYHRTKRRECHLKHQYNLSQEEYEALVNFQKGVCAICGKEETAVDPRYKTVRKMAVDHDHETGKVRGLLCSRCNKGIGAMEDSPELLLKAVVYLERQF